MSKTPYRYNKFKTHHNDSEKLKSLINSKLKRRKAMSFSYFIINLENTILMISKIFSSIINFKFLVWMNINSEKFSLIK